MDLIEGIATLIAAWFINKVRLAVWSILDMILLLIRATPEQRCFFAGAVYLAWVEASLEQIKQGKIKNPRTKERVKRFHLRNPDRLKKLQRKVRGLEPPDGKDDPFP